MKQLLLLLGMSYAVVGCSGAGGVDDSSGDEQAITASGAEAPQDSVARVRAGGKAPASRSIDLTVGAFRHEEQEGPVDPYPWRLPPTDEAAKEDAPTK